MFTTSKGVICLLSICDKILSVWVDGKMKVALQYVRLFCV